MAVCTWYRTVLGTNVSEARTQYRRGRAVKIREVIPVGHVEDFVIDRILTCMCYCEKGLDSWQLGFSDRNTRVVTPVDWLLSCSGSCLTCMCFTVNRSWIY